MRKLLYVSAVSVLAMPLGVAFAASPVPAGLTSTPVNQPFLAGPAPVGQSCRYGTFATVVKGRKGFAIPVCQMSIAQCQAAGGSFTQNFQGAWQCAIKS